MTVSFVGAASAVSGGAFSMPGGIAADDVAVLNYGSAFIGTGVTFDTPAGFEVVASTNSVSGRTQFVFVGPADAGPPDIDCSAGSEYACTVGVFRGVDTTDPVASFSAFSFTNQLAIVVPSPGAAVTGGMAVGCIFIEDDNGLSSWTPGALAVSVAEVTGENSSSHLGYWPSPDQPNPWRLGAVHMGGTGTGVQVPTASVNVDAADPYVVMSLLLRPA